MKKHYYGRHLSAFSVRQQSSGTQVHQTAQGIGYLLHRVYFLRPSLWRNWRAYIRAPHHMVGMWIMLTGEMVFGGFGFIQGYFSRA